MYISEYMTPDPITVSPEMLLPEARLILNTYHIRHLPVVDREKKLVGIVTDRDLRSAYPSSVSTRHEQMVEFARVEKMTVADIMTTTCAALSPDSSLDDALLVFDREQIGGIPVLDEAGVVLGFFSILDLTAAYRRLFGMMEKGSLLIGVEDDGRENIMSEIVIMLENNGIVLTRLIRLADEDDVAKIYMRINSPNPAEVYTLLKTSGFSLLR
ncbi:MAG: CBS domain-containing protein [Pseudomonadota bacterium]